ncbi:MAG: polyprenyl synthetase family protein [Patescibacteria group bacterium]
MSFLKKFKERFDPRLNSYLDNKLGQAANLLDDPDLIAMIDHLTKIVRHGGKRLRPYLIDLSYRMAGGTNQAMIEPALFGMELFHTYCLVHDDILDRADERHSLPTVDIFVRNRLESAGRIGAKNLISTSQAILAGDLLASWADEAFLQTEITSLTQQAALKIFFTMQTEVICGQMIDIDLTTRTSVTDAMIDKKIWLKTASYSFLGPIRIGLALSGSDLANWDIFSQEMAGKLGRAFQIQDDLREVFVENDFRDISERQPTYLTAHVIKYGSAAQQATLQQLFGQSIDLDKGNRLKNLFQESGAAETAHTSVTNYLKQASLILETRQLAKPIQDEWSELIELIRQFV